MTSRNPLRDPRDRRLPRVPAPCALVVFGVTGDLSRKKLIPAVYDLANRGLLPPGFVLLGFARRDWGDGDFETLARSAAQKGARTEFRDSTWSRLAYQHYEAVFSSDRWKALEAAGARPQRPLWASTGVKDPKYDDTQYVVELVAPGTVNTMPEATLEAVFDHG